MQIHTTTTNHFEGDFHQVGTQDLHEFDTPFIKNCIER